MCTLAIAACLALSIPATAQQILDVPSSPRIVVQEHGVEVSIAGVYHNLLQSWYIQIRERNIGEPNWRAVYGHQHAATDLADVVKRAGGYPQYVNSLLPQYNAFLASRYPALGTAPVFGTSPLDQLNKTLYEGFMFVMQANGAISVGPK